MISTPKGTRAPRRYVVVTRTAYANTDGRNLRNEAGTFASKADALAAARAALDGFRVTFAKVEREVWTEGIDPLMLTPWAAWTFDGEVKEFSRYLRADERR